jgi:hypothetical protein
VVGQGFHLGWFCKEGEEKTRKEEEKEWLAEFHLNFEKFKNWSK